MSAIVLVAGSAQLIGQASGDWVEFHRAEMDRWNSYEHVLNVNNAASLALRWEYYFGSFEHTAPAVANGVVYFSSGNNSVYALNASTGGILWSYATGGPALSSSPAVANGVVYVGSWDKNIYALNASTGAKLWSFTTGNSVQSSPTVANGVLYSGSADSNVYALNASTGVVVWSYHTGGFVTSSPAVANGVVYVGSFDSNVYALNASTGTKLWSFRAGNLVASSPAVTNGVLYVGSGDGNVYALDAGTGAKLWSFTTGNSVQSSPAVANGVVYVGSDDGNVYALDAGTGAKLWSFTTGNSVQSSPAVANGVVYVGSNDKNVYALNANTGALAWTYPTGDSVDSSPAVANGVVYIASTYLYAFSASQGFLTFPLHGMSPGKNQNLTAQTAQINTVFDHKMLEAAGHYSVYGCDKRVEDFIGEVGSTNPSKFHVACRYGYQNVTKGFKFLQGVANYSPGDSTNLYYDGHPGFDYQSGYGNQVYAAASGTVSYPTLSKLNSEGIWVGGNPDVFNTMELDPGNGYKIFYLHMSTHTRSIATGSLTSSRTGQNFVATKTGKTPTLIPGTLPVQSPLFISGQVTLNGQPLPGIQVNLNGNVAVGANGTCTAFTKTDSSGNYMFVGLGSGYKYNLYISPTKGYTFAAQSPSVLVSDGTSVSAGELIGLSGDAGPCFFSHLHFEVQQKTNTAVAMYPANSQQIMMVNYVPVDPYGWSPSDQSLTDPYTLIPELQGAGVMNLYIWK